MSNPVIHPARRPGNAAASQPGQLPAGSIGLFDTTSSTLANIAPALSVFLTIPAIVISMGTMAPWAFALAAVAILATGNSLIEFTRRMPSAGGFISYITRAASGARTGSGSKAGTFLGAMTFYLLLRGTGVSVRTAFLMFLTEALVLVVFAVVVLARAHSALGAPFHAAGGSPGGFAGISGLTFALAVYCYVGWENSGPLAEESRDPRRTIPRTVVLSIAITTVVFFLAAYALVVGFAGWQGASKGMASIGTLASPYLTLTGQYAPWLKFIMFLIGITSSFGCYLAAGLPGSRYIFHGARAGLLPRPFARVSGRSGVPAMAIATYVALIVVVTVVLDAILGNPVTIATYEAGISTVPLLIIYGVTCVLLPFFVWRTDRPSFSVLRHALFPLIGLAVVGYGVWESVNPGQAAPANKYWIYVLAYLVVAALGACYALRPGGASAEVLSKGVTEE